MIGGSAIAVGDASAVTGFVENVAIDKGAISIAMGEAISGVGAVSQPERRRSRRRHLSRCVGADFVIEREVGAQARRSRRVGLLLELDYLAIDIHGWSPPHGPIVIELGGPSGHHQSFGHDTLQGEFAQVFAMAEAHGANTLSATLTSCADGRKPLFVRECNGNGGALGASQPGGQGRSLAPKGDWRYVRKHQHLLCLR